MANGRLDARVVDYAPMPGHSDVAVSLVGEEDRSAYWCGFKTANLFSTAEPFGVGAIIEVDRWPLPTRVRYQGREIWRDPGRAARRT